MLFCSHQFILFFIAVFTVYWALPWHRARVWLLLAASIGFYATWSHRLAVLICLTSTADYLIGRRLEIVTALGRRRLLLLASITANLGLLCYFKYANFFLQSFLDLLHALHVHASPYVLQVMLPIGISFYTFEAISYTVDVYHRRIPAERNLAHFLLFILFFPHLVAGPVVRARDFLPQVARRKRWSWPRLHLGLQFFILGMFKKLAIADRMDLFAQPVFADQAAFRTSALWLGALAFVIQLYCDFSGYSDMAIGLAHALGYKLTRNFDLPYLSASIAEFWRRWHISLSTWLRDYLFIPLGGSRGRLRRTCRNFMIVMTLGGLWHGASWPCVVFGALHGTWLCLHRGFRAFCERRPRLGAMLHTAVGRGLCIIGTFGTFTLTLAVFRSPTLKAGMGMLHGMLTDRAGARLPLSASSLIWLVGLVVICHLLARRGLAGRLLLLLPPPVRGLGYALVTSLALVLAPDAGKAFIYFQF